MKIMIMREYIVFIRLLADIARNIFVTMIMVVKQITIMRIYVRNAAISFKKVTPTQKHQQSAHINI